MKKSLYRPSFSLTVVFYYFFSLIVPMTLLRCTDGLPPGDPDHGGLILPEGFEAVVVADTLGRARHLAVNDNGDVYVKLRVARPGGENVGLRDTDGDGKADLITYFASFEGQGRYATGMRIHEGYLYYSTAATVFRQKLTPGKLVPQSEPEAIVIDDYQNDVHGYEHIAKPLALDDAGNLYVPFGAPGDVCQVENRKPGSPGQFPCPELEEHGGIWRFDADKPGQTIKDGYRYATGIRSVVAMDWNHADSTLYVLQHGRDDLVRNWPEYYDHWESALLPSEEFLRVEEGIDAGWPYYYYDHLQGKKLLNPEYGGDGQKEGDGTDYQQPLIGFPGHWAPNDLYFYEGDQFPARYKNGAFIAFHGSTIRAPYPQGGYFIAFVPFERGAPSGPWEVFADGFPQVDTIVYTSDAVYRPMGIAMGPDGSLYVSESEKGRIWRIMYKGDKESFGDAQLAAMEARKTQPHIKTPDRELDNLDRGRALAGAATYQQYCASCHLGNGQGDGTRYPSIAGSEWVTGDKKRLIGVVLNGLQGPITVKGQPFQGVMPAQSFLTDQQIAEVLTFVRQRFGEGASGVYEGEVRRVRRMIERQKKEEEAETEETI